MPALPPDTETVEINKWMSLLFPPGKTDSKHIKAQRCLKIAKCHQRHKRLKVSSQGPTNPGHMSPVFAQKLFGDTATPSQLFYNCFNYITTDLVPSKVPIHIPY